MTLDPDFAKQTSDLIVNTLELYKKTGVSPRVEQVWNCKNKGDFLCGFFTGTMVGSALAAFQTIHKRETTPEEHIEIIEIIEGYSQEIKEFFTKFN